MGKPGTIGERVAVLRARAGLTQTELAMRAGVSKGAIVKIELGHRPDPGIKTALAIAKALRVPLSALTGIPSEATERAVKAYRESSHAKSLADDGQPVTDEEAEWLGYMVESIWVQGEWNPRTLHDFLQNYRKHPELRRL